MGWKRAAVSALLAYALALQTLLLAASGALHAAPANLSQAAQCVTESASAPDHESGKAHAALCCTLSCHGSGTCGGPVPVAASPVHRTSLRLATGPVSHPPFLRLATNVLPVGSRAPPRLG